MLKGKVDGILSLPPIPAFNEKILTEYNLVPLYLTCLHSLGA
jgi:hypothetical protein